MNSARSQQIHELYEAALSRPAAERESFIAERAAGDAGLRESVELLLSRRDATELRQPEAPESRAPIAAGTQIGSYRIDALVAEGGMGSVYRATDTKLHRPVAIKFLSAAIADEQARRRFRQEAEATSSLNHPHIVTVHDVGEHDGRQYIVSEFVDGGTLSEWAVRPHAWKQRVELLIGVADAIAAAHAADILHRDIKPGNILIGSNGYAKLADFGLAKLVGENAADPGRARTQHTGVGVVIGTVAYMSPEQVAGQPLDERSDVFSFGVVLYEVLGGRRPFEGANDLELMKTIVHGAPKPLSDSLPELLRMAVDKALEKDPAERYQSMRELVVDLKRVVQRRAAAAPAEPARRGVRAGWTVAAALGVALVAALVATTAYFLKHEPAAPQVRFGIDAPGLTAQADNPFAVSPDGRRIAFVATTDGTARIWIRSIDALDVQPVPSTEGATSVFWSPDGRALAFQVDSRLEKITLGGGSAHALTDAGVAGGGGDWNRDGTIIFVSPAAAKGTGAAAIGRITADGGAMTPVTTVDVASGQIAHFAPTFLPDGRHFIYVAGRFARENVRSVDLYLGSLDGAASQRVMTLDTGRAGTLTPQAAYAAGHLLFTRDRTLLAQRFDPDTHVLGGGPQTLVASVQQFSVADNVLAYVEPVAARGGQTGGALSELRWFDRDGRPAGTLGAAEQYDNPSLSPDGRRLAVDIVDSGNRDVWIIDLARGVPARRTFDTALDVVPIWSPDGEHIVFASSRDGGDFPSSLYRRAASGSGTDELLFAAGVSNGIAPLDWTRDGKYLVFGQVSLAEITSGTGGGIFLLPLSGERTPPVKLLQRPGRTAAARVSPDDRWISYSTNESGGYQIVVQPFPDTSQGKWQISTRGGVEAKWRGDGRELFYLATDGTMMAVDVEAGDTFVAGEPHALFQTGLVIPAAPFSFSFDVTADGQRFLINVPQKSTSAEPGAAASSTIKVVLNWATSLERAH